MRQWLSTALLAVAGGVTSWVGFWLVPENAWIGTTLLILTISAVVLAFPFRRRTQSVTFKGDLEGSTITDVDSTADTLFHGAVRQSIISRIRHRPRRGLR